MAIHLYGVVEPSSTATIDHPGLDGRPLRLVAVGPYGAWVSDVDELKLVVTPKRLKEHDRVLRSIVASGVALVPARLGRLYADDASVAGEIRARTPALAEGMSVARGRVEMSLLVARTAKLRTSANDAPREARAGRGRVHLERLRSELHGERNVLYVANALVESAASALGSIILAERIVKDPAPPVLVARAHLVSRDDVPRYVAAIDSITAQLPPSVRLAVRGPGATYSFAVIHSD